MNDSRYNHGNIYEAEAASKGSAERKRSNPEDKVLPIFLIIAVIMFATGHYPHIF